jgi:ParB family chromosome partitioning protein
MSQVTVKPLSWFKVNPQVRKFFDEEGLRRLGESLKVKQLQSLLCLPDGTIIAGERRFRAAQAVGLEFLEVKIVEEKPSDSQIRVWQITENMQREDLTGFEKWTGCAELMCMNPTWQLKDLAGHLHLDPSMVTRLLAPSKCIAAVQEALASGKIGISDCYAISKLPEAEQEGLLALKLGGASRDAIEQAGRKNRKGVTKAVRLSRVKIAMPEATLVITGKDLGMAQVLEVLSETLKEARKAAEQFDVKTWVSMMRDKAKTAG